MPKEEIFSRGTLSFELTNHVELAWWARGAPNRPKSEKQLFGRFMFELVSFTLRAKSISKSADQKSVLTKIIVDFRFANGLAGVGGLVGEKNI